MSTTTQVLGSRTSLASASLATLASANYCVSSAYTAATADPVDVLVDVLLTSTNVPSGNKQAKVFVKVSQDGTNYTSGPETSTTITQEPNLYFLGTVAMPTTSQAESKSFSIFNSVGWVPFSFKVIVFNDLGVALTSGTLFTTEVSSVTT